jgi:hypothetical protein
MNDGRFQLLFAGKLKPLFCRTSVTNSASTSNLFLMSDQAIVKTHTKVRPFVQLHATASSSVDGQQCSKFGHTGVTTNAVNCDSSFAGKLTAIVT